MTAFCDLPDAQRLALRDAIDAAGGDISMYDGEGVLVALPSPTGPFYRTMEEAGLELVPGSLHTFPLGSDNPPEHMRHSMAKYGPVKGFWLYGQFVLSASKEPMASA